MLSLRIHRREKGFPLIFVIRRSASSALAQAAISPTFAP